MAGARPIPETFNRQDWPRLVAAAIRDIRGKLESGGTGGAILDLDGGDVAGVTGPSFDFDGGTA